MGCTYCLIRVFLVVVICQLIDADDDDKEEMCDCIGMQINGDTASCGDDWKDAPVQMTFYPQMESGEGDDEPPSLYLSGTVSVASELPEEGLQVALGLDLWGPAGRETVWSSSADLCQAMEKDDAPWSPILNTMGNKCPILKGEYEVPKMKMDLSFINPYMNEDFIGKYTMQINIKKAVDKYVCSELGAEVDEFRMPCSKCQKPGE